MKYSTFIDTNIFIYALEIEKSNSSIITRLLNQGEIEGIVSERVLKELYFYIKTRMRNEKLAKEIRDFVYSSCIVISNEFVKDYIAKFEGKIKDKDLEQLAAVKKLGIKFLISYDRDFEEFDEYITPKSFVKLMGLKPFETEF